MEPSKIIEREQIILVGYSFYGDPFTISEEWTEENEIGRLWKRLMAYLSANKNRIHHIKNHDACYEVHIQTEESASKGFVEVFAGMEVEKLEHVPLELLVKILPPSKYAIFTLKGQEIVSDWHLVIYHEWLPASGFHSAHNFSFQLYDHRFKSLHALEGAELDVYIPITSK